MVADIACSSGAPGCTAFAFLSWGLFFMLHIFSTVVVLLSLCVFAYPGMSLLPDLQFLNTGILITFQFVHTLSSAFSTKYQETQNKKFSCQGYLRFFDANFRMAAVLALNSIGQIVTHDVKL